MSSKEDRILTEVSGHVKGYGSTKIMSEFPEKNGQLLPLNRMLHQIDLTASADCE